MLTDKSANPLKSKSNRSRGANGKPHPVKSITQASGEVVRFWIDGEWNDFKGDLISLALVCEDGSEWYEVLECNNPSPWVARHVLPVTQKHPVSKAQMQVSLSKYLARYPAVHIIADWPEDIERFCALLITGPGEMLMLRQIRLTFEIDRDLDSNGSKIPHQALADARSMKVKYSLAHREGD
jgi:hypothetical protein